MSSQDPVTKRIPVPAAEIVKEEKFRIAGGCNVVDRYFNVPLDYSQPEGEKIRIFARSAIRDKDNDKDQEAIDKLPTCVYLQGGPGYECSSGLPTSSPLTGWMTDRGYQMLFLDQRGTGLSTPVCSLSLEKRGGPEEQKKWLMSFRADNIVRDCEAIRKALLGEKTWTIAGQSFGGFCSVTYLSFYPEGLKEAFIFGGLPPLVDDPDRVYEQTYKHVAKRNGVYYNKYPNDVEAVKKIVRFLSENDVKLPTGNVLSPARFLSLGLRFGGHGGLDAVHQIVNRLSNELDLFFGLSFKMLNMLENALGFDDNPIYAILHESIYCQGRASHWSAERQKTDSRFKWDAAQSSSAQPVYFTGEMVYPAMFDEYAELRKMKDAANLLARETNWPPLYDVEKLKQNTVPVYAAIYMEDMYVDFGLSVETANTIKGTKTFVSNVMHHNAVRAKTDAVMGNLWKLKVEADD